MKKFLILFVGILSFFGINSVSADTINNFYLNGDFKDSYYFSSNYSYDFIDKETDNLIAIWKERYKNDYPYYSIYLSHGGLSFSIKLIMYKAYPSNYSAFLSFSETNTNEIYSLEYRFENGEKLDCILGSSCFEDIYWFGSPTDFIFRDLFYIDSENNNTYRPQFYYDSNFELIYNLVDTYNIVKNDEIIHTLNNGDIIPTYKDLFINNIKDEYVLVNLNDYSYVALSLKDYETIPESNSSKYTNIYVKGQLCVTPVYNYGLTERKDILTNSIMQGCSQYYNDFTLTRMYILKTDVENHAIYYFKAYDTTKDNILKVDSSLFNITYISEENKDTPEVLINNKYYPTLPYDSLTDTATKSESDGFISGATCAVGDFNCYSENNAENIFDNIFSSPLDFLKDIWSSVTNVFSIITEFITLLPLEMQSFLYLSFMIAIILGLLKIIL